MRLGIVTIPRQLPTNGTSMIDHVTDIARRVEDLGLHGLWVTDAFARGWPTLDPLVLLGALSAATSASNWAPASCRFRSVIR